jgi:hypothetical protein
MYVQNEHPLKLSVSLEVTSVQFCYVGSNLNVLWRRITSFEQKYGVWKDWPPLVCLVMQEMNNCFIGMGKRKGKMIGPKIVFRINQSCWEREKKHNRFETLKRV